MHSIMELFQFIKDPVKYCKESSADVFIFQGSHYQDIFFSHVFHLFSHILPYENKFLDLQDDSWKSILATSFLGMSCFYWLSDISALKQKQKEELIVFLQDYQGPHKIILFIDMKTKFAFKKHGIVINLPDKIFYDDAKKIFIAQDISQASQQALFLQKIYKVKNYFSLNELYSLQQYIMMIPEGEQAFYDHWMPRLVLSETSLFQLSQFLFEKNKEKFFELWLVMKTMYSPMFWVSFWSDQIYRAYFYVESLSKNNGILAKTVSYGLPFSFIKYGYKQYKLDELQKIHQALCSVDMQLKHGGNEYFLDAILAQIFLTNR